MTGRTPAFSVVLMLAATVAVIALAIAVPLSLRLSPERIAVITPEERPDCWGCAPFDTMSALFTLQRDAAIPLARSNDPLRGTNARARVEAANAALTTLQQLRSDCLEDETCRNGPGAFRDLICQGDWPDEFTRRALEEAVAGLNQVAATCRGYACPGLDCATRTRVTQVLSTLQTTLDRMVRDFSPDVGGEEATATSLDGVARAIEQLPLLLVSEDQAAVAGWARRAETLAANIVTRESTLGWRGHLLASHLEGLADELLEPGLEQDWALIARRASQTLAQVRFIEWDMVQGREARACLRAHPVEIRRMADELNGVEAAIAVCGTRSGCGEDVEPSPILSSLAERDSISSVGIVDFVTSGLQLLATETDLLRLTEGAPVTLTSDLPSYRPGEAITMSARSDGNQCVAAPGAWLGLFNDAGDLLADRPVTGEEGNADILAAAPEEGGPLVARAFAPLERGGAELASQPLFVAEPMETCDGLSGIWDTSFGTLHLVVRGEEVRGSYVRSAGYEPGFLLGEMHGRVFYGEWSSELGGGGARLVLSADGRSFRGTWSHRRDSFAGSGIWRGTCVLPAP